MKYEQMVAGLTYFLKCGIIIIVNEKKKEGK